MFVEWINHPEVTAAEVWEDVGNGIESDAVFQINDGHDVILPDCMIK